MGPVCGGGGTAVRGDGGWRWRLEKEAVEVVAGGLKRLLTYRI